MSVLKHFKEAHTQIGDKAYYELTKKDIKALKLKKPGKRFACEYAMSILEYSTFLKRFLDVFHNFHKTAPYNNELMIIRPDFNLILRNFLYFVFYANRGRKIWNKGCCL